jgi:hypothetical protein
MHRYEVLVDGKPHDIPEMDAWAPIAAAATVWNVPGLVEFWAEYDTGAPVMARTVQVVGTGHPIPPDATWAATCPRTTDGLVRHLYELPRPGGR